MFTGIVTAVGVVESVEKRAQCRRLVINTDMDWGDGKLGESIALNGCCLTVVEFVSGGFAVDVAQESLKVTTLGGLQAGSRVNLERALRLADRLGGHWVQGHVDGIGTLVRKETQAEGELWELTFPPELAKYLVKKGSITIDGVSLTLNKVGKQSLEIFLIPHTLAETTLGGLPEGASLNLEVDILGKYIETLLAPSR